MPNPVSARVTVEATPEGGLGRIHVQRDIPSIGFKFLKRILPALEELDRRSRGESLRPERRPR
jgi:hypothetical protein